MSLKQKEEITIWAFKDGKKGHEKQVEALISELSLYRKINLFEFEMWESHTSVPDLIIGAGHKTYSYILDIKKSQKKSCKTVAILTPTFKKDHFDLICAPSHDQNKYTNPKNVIFYEGSLAKVSLNEPDENVILVAVGGKNKHYHFDEDSIYASWPLPLLKVELNKRNSRRSVRIRLSNTLLS